MISNGMDADTSNNVMNGAGDNEWFHLDELARECQPLYLPNQERVDRHRIRHELIVKTEEIMFNMVDIIRENEIPRVSLKRRKEMKNIRFVRDVGLLLKEDASTSEVNLVSHKKKFALIMFLLDKIHELLINDGYSTKRDVFYQNKPLFVEQKVIDDLIDDLSCMFSVPRKELRILASSKGYLVGNLEFIDTEGKYISCQGNCPISVPSDVDSIRIVESQAKFILVVEKDATFRKLLDDNFQSHTCPCIIVTGKGFPDVNTRELVRKLWLQLRIPVLGLADCDPDGIEILLCYKYGSRAMSFINESLTVPTIKWIGIHPNDLCRFNIPNTATMPLTPREINKLNGFLIRPYIHNCPQWINQMRLMIEMGRKAEIQVFNEISATYLSRVYLPHKIKMAGYL